MTRERGSKSGSSPQAPSESSPSRPPGSQVGSDRSADLEWAPTERPCEGDLAEGQEGETASSLEAGARYEEVGTLGRGGMAEVALCRDRRMEREVAVKTMRRDLPRSFEARFLAEARLQGRLEHPAIVPVHDLDRAADGSPYFTMKRLRGRTLEAVLADLRAGDGETAAAFSTRRLLGAFSRVCEAVDFAHARGVIHRDLKPSNVVLGDYGEVYVLDWGVAQVDGEGWGAPPRGKGEAERADERERAVMGTPAYMAPEQWRGEPLDRRADVYALGAILYEILYREPLHSPRAGRGPAPADRETELAPELDDLCRRMTAESPDGRPASADRVRDAIDSYMAGARDEERRRELARERAEAAERAAAEGDRPAAMREAGRALALVPEHPAALATLMRLLIDAPDELPPEVEREVAEESDPLLRGQARRGALAGSAALIALVPLLLWMGVRDWTLFTALGLAVIANNASWFWFARSRVRSEAAIIAGAVLTAVAIVAASRIFGPLLVVPAAAVTTTIGYLLQPAVRRHGLFIAIGCASIAAPLALEVAGIWRSSYTFAGDALAIEPNVVALPETPTIFFLLVWSTGLVAVSGLVIAAFRRALTRAERKLHFQAWQLRQLVPSGAARVGREGPR